MDHRDIGALDELDLGRHAFHDLAAIIVDVLALGGVVAEHANERRAEELGEFDGVLELFEVRLEWLVQPDLADGRADGADLQAVVPKQRAGLVQLLLRQVHDVLLTEEPRLDVPNLLLHQVLDLPAKILHRLIRKRTQLCHLDHS